jgi:signal transduction histidine kinase
MNKFFFLELLFFAFCSSVFSQERGLLLSNYYSPITYKAKPANWGIVKDSRGVVYFANGSGVLEYDGLNWNLIELPNASKSIAIDNRDRIFVGGFGMLGFLNPDSKGKLSYVSLLPLIDSTHKIFNDVWDIHIIGDTVYFLTDYCIYKYYNKQFKYFDTDNSESFYLSYIIDNEYIVYKLNKGLYLISGNNLKFIEGSQQLATLKIHSILPIDNKLLICTRKNGFYLADYDGAFKNLKSLSSISKKGKQLNEYFKKYLFYHGIAISDSLFALASIMGDALIVDKNLNVTDVIDENTFGIKTNVNCFRYDSSGVLWMALSNGLAKVELASPFRYWNESLGINGLLTDVASRGDYIYVATSSGVFYIDRNRPENFKPHRFQLLKGPLEQTWQFLYFKDPSEPESYKPLWVGSNSKTHLLVVARNGVFEIINDKAILVDDTQQPFVIIQGRKNPNFLFIGHNRGVTRLKFNNGTWISKFNLLETEGVVYSMGEDGGGNLWVLFRQDELWRIKNPYCRKVKKIECATYDISLKDSTDSFDRIVDAYDSIIFQTQKRYFSYFPNGDSIGTIDVTPFVKFADSIQRYDSLAAMRIDSQMVTSVYVTDFRDPVSWVSSDFGIVSMTSTVHYNRIKLNPPLIKRVVNIDSVLFEGVNFFQEPVDLLNGVAIRNTNPDRIVDLGTVLPYDRNSIVFNFVWPYYIGEDKIKYSYQLVGNDEEWSDWTYETRKEYTNLKEGDYIFRVKAKNVFKDETPIAEFHFTIKTPWFRSIIAYIAYIILAILLIYFSVRVWHYRLIRERNKLDRLVKERTQEILLQKEELQVQAEHLKEAYDWISEKNEILEQQKHEIEKQKNELEAINATKNKFFRIIAHDLRNPISTLVNSTEFLLTEINALNSDKVKQFMTELNKLALTTYNLLENLLDWSSNEMGDIKNNPKWVDLRSLVLQNLELIQGRLKDKNIDVEVEIPEGFEIFVDDNILNTILRNLISNALKFSKLNGRINLKTSLENEKWVLKVSDNGIGIPEQNIDKLFKIDKTIVTAGTQNEKGSGLGLLLCKEFVEKIGGEIKVESKVGVGTTFTVIIPAIKRD